MFEGLKKLFSRKQEEPAASLPPRGAEKIDLNLEIAVQEDGFRLKNKGNVIKNGDRLLVSYTTDGENWQHKVLDFYQERGGMFVFTGEKPQGIVVMPEDQVSKCTSFKAVPRVTYQAARRRTERLPEDSGAFFDPGNVLSPFFGCGFSNPLGLLQLYLYQDQDSHRPEQTAPSVVPPAVEHYRDSYPGTNLPPAAISADPFDPKGVSADQHGNGPEQPPQRGEGFGGDAGLGETKEGGSWGSGNTGIELEAPDTGSSTNSFGTPSEPKAY